MGEGGEREGGYNRMRAGPLSPPSPTPSPASPSVQESLFAGYPSQRASRRCPSGFGPPRFLSLADMVLPDKIRSRIWTPPRGFGPPCKTVITPRKKGCLIRSMLEVNIFHEFCVFMRRASLCVEILVDRNASSLYSVFINEDFS